MKRAQDRYNAFFAESVLPSLPMGDQESERGSFVDIAAVIRDEDVRTRYVSLAIELLRANISAQESLATGQADPPVARPPIGGTLLGAAVGYSLSGPVAALVAAAVTYGLLDGYQRNRHRALELSIRAHNAEVPVGGEPWMIGGTRCTSCSGSLSSNVSGLAGRLRR